MPRCYKSEVYENYDPSAEWVNVSGTLVPPSGRNVMCDVLNAGFAQCSARDQGYLCDKWQGYVYASRAVQRHPSGGRFDFAYSSARTPHVGPPYV